MSIGGRFKILRGDKSQSEFAELIGSNKQNISRYEKDIMMPGGDVLLRLVTSLRVNINWLLTGKGSPYITDKENFIIEKRKNKRSIY